MVATITFNPVITTNAAGSFNVQSAGYVQGTALDQPAIRNSLAGGVLATTETLPMWGGVGISEAVPGVAGGPSSTLGGIITRATNATGGGTAGSLTGFSVFDQDHSMINTPQSPVPLAGSGMSVHYYRFGSGARIPVACDPSLVSLEGEIINTKVSWDFVNQMLVPYIGTLTISSGTYNSTTGLVTLTMSAAVGFDAGDSIIVSSLTGTGAYASLDGTYTAISASGTTVTYQAASGLGASTITGGSLTLGSGSDVAIAVEVLDVNIGNSMTVQYNTVTGFATWNRSGSTALVLI